MSKYDGLSNREVLYRYVAEDVLPILKETGSWTAPDPAPLDHNVVIDEFERIRKHPNYRGQRLMTRTEDGYFVILSGEEITHGPIQEVPVRSAHLPSFEQLARRETICYTAARRQALRPESSEFSAERSDQLADTTKRGNRLT